MFRQAQKRQLTQRKGEDGLNEKKVSENTFRHELKYKIGYLQYMELKNRLKSVMQSDAHAGSDGKYLIRSIYSIITWIKLYGKRLTAFPGGRNSEYDIIMMIFLT